MKTAPQYKYRPDNGKFIIESFVYSISNDSIFCKEGTEFVNFVCEERTESEAMSTINKLMLLC